MKRLLHLGIERPPESLPAPILDRVWEAEGLEVDMATAERWARKAGLLEAPLRQSARPTA